MKSIKNKIKKLTVRQFIRIPVVFYSTIITVAAIVAILILLFAVAGDMPSKVPLLYSIAWGENRLVATPVLLAIPFLIVLLYALHFVFSLLLYKRYMLLTNLLMISVAFFACFLLYDIVRILVLLL
jgi:hypothetical protein